MDAARRTSLVERLARGRWLPADDSWFLTESVSHPKTPGARLAGAVAREALLVLSAVIRTFAAGGGDTERAAPAGVGSLSRQTFLLLATPHKASLSYHFLSPRMTSRATLPLSLPLPL